MTALATRPDLAQRTALSKSALAQFDVCPTKSWFAQNAQVPFVPNERVVFGSAVDAGVEVLIVQRRALQTPDLGAAEQAAKDVVLDERRNSGRVRVDGNELTLALAAFIPEVLPFFDWSYAVTQRNLHALLPPFGECDGHPDILLGTGDGTFGTILDVKTASKAKTEAAVQTSVELGFYCLLAEAETGVLPGTVGYLTWTRTAKPRWQILTEPVTDLLLERTRYAARHYQFVKDAPEPFGGPKFASACLDCQYAGECPIAYRPEEERDAVPA